MIQKTPMTTGAETALTTVAVLGAGQMGRGIAETCAVAGITVHLYDAVEAALPAAREKINANLRRGRGKNPLSVEDTEKADAAIARIVLQPRLADWLGAAAVVIEAISENADSKKQLYAACAPYLAADAVLATNTSSLSIGELAAGLAAAEKFIGMHFMNPVPRMQLVEIIRGAKTDEATYARICALAQQLGKQTVTAADCPGFITNRILLPMLNEAVFALAQGVGGVHDIDRAMTLGMRHPMGPLMLADFIGLDTCLAILRVLHDGFGEEKYRPCPLFAVLVEAGELGKKSGLGFYDYRSGEVVAAGRFGLVE